MKTNPDPSQPETSRIQRSAGFLRDRAERAWSAVRAHPFRTLTILPALAVIYVAAHYPFTPSIGDIKKSKQEQPTVVLSADGKELAVYKRANRDWVKLADISPKVVDALISTEDHRFFQHSGFDVKRTASALVNTLGGDRQGGSTLTQQLARNLYPDEVGREVTITRKIKEAITAFKIEAVYSKEEILETYLNTVPFLYNAYGIEMAAQTYFDKPAKQLDELEAATLVGMLKGTSYYNPVLNPERSVERRNVVLAQMVRHQKLEPAKYEQLKARPMRLDFERQLEETGPAPHMARQLRQWLIDWADRKGYNIYADGLVVRTTIDSRLQAFANDAVRKQGDKLQPQADARATALRGNKAVVQAFIRDTVPYREARQAGASDEDVIAKLQQDEVFMKKMWANKARLEAGFMAMEPSTGFIRAWVGSRDFNEDQFDHVQQARRQPGSTFKPFVYGAAFEAGASPSDTLMDSAVEIRIDRNQVWRPTDVDPPTNQMMTLRDALAQSKNTVTAQLMQRVGPSRVAELAQSAGVRQSKLQAVPALALGTSPVTLKEMVTSYSTIANSGAYVEPLLVTRVEDRSGQVLEEFQPASPQQVMSQNSAQTLVDVMRAVIDKGTAIRIRAVYGIKADVAGKTGTTQNDTDGWFIMMHPNLVAGAWVGFNDARVTMLHEWGQGARSALPIVGDVYQQALLAKVIDPAAQFAAPRDKGVLDRVNDWFGSIFQSAPSPVPATEVAATPSTPLPELPKWEPSQRQSDGSTAVMQEPSAAGTATASFGNAQPLGGSPAPSILSLPSVSSGRSTALPAPGIASVPAGSVVVTPGPASGAAVLGAAGSTRSSAVTSSGPSSTASVEPAPRSSSSMSTSTPQVITIPSSSGSGSDTVTRIEPSGSTRDNTGIVRAPPMLSSSPSSSGSTSNSSSAASGGSGQSGSSGPATVGNYTIIGPSSATPATGSVRSSSGTSSPAVSRSELPSTSLPTPAREERPALSQATGSISPSTGSVTSRGDSSAPSTTESSGTDKD